MNNAEDIAPFFMLLELHTHYGTVGLWAAIIAILVVEVGRAIIGVIYE